MSNLNKKATYENGQPVWFYWGPRGGWVTGVVGEFDGYNDGWSRYWITTWDPDDWSKYCGAITVRWLRPCNPIFGGKDKPLGPATDDYFE